MLVSSMGAVVAGLFSTSNFSTGKALAGERASESRTDPSPRPCAHRRGSCPPPPVPPRRREPVAKRRFPGAGRRGSTVAVTEIMALSLAAALSALASWMSFSPTPRTIISDIMIPARGSPVANEMLARTASRITSGLSTACQSSMARLTRWSFAKTFGPYRSSRARASRELSPSRRVENRARTASTSIAAESTKLCEISVCGLSMRMAARRLLGRIPV